MIRVSNARIETPIELSPGSPVVLTIESPREFYLLVGDMIGLLGGAETSFSLWDGDMRIKLSDRCEIVADVFSFEVTDRKIVTALYKRLQSNFLDGDFVVPFGEAATAAENFLGALCDTVDFPIEYDELSLDALLKAFAVRPAKNYDTLLEKIVAYIDIFAELKRVDVFVFVGLKSVMPDDELALLYRHCELKKIALLLIESHRARPPLAPERSIIITDDLCEIVENFG